MQQLANCGAGGYGGVALNQKRRACFLGYAFSAHLQDAVKHASVNHPLFARHGWVAGPEAFTAPSQISVH